MAERFLYGTDLAASMVEDSRAQLARNQELGRVAHFTTVLVGNDPASEKYIAMKQQEGAGLGIEMSDVRLAETTPQQEIEEIVAELSDNDAVHAILVQYPLPRKLDYLAVVKNIKPEKDADGLHPFNLGLLLHDPMKNYPGIIPCTPQGILQILHYGEVEVERADIAVVGRGMTVGAPLSMLLSARNNGPAATVTTVHRDTRNIAKHTKDADIVIGATGVPDLLDDSMIKPGATLVSVGVAYDQARKAHGDFSSSARERAGTYVPVTNGIGPMTRANLWSNVLRCCELQQAFNAPDLSILRDAYEVGPQPLQL